MKHERKILVTGATGFLGKKLTQRLLAESYSVRIFARKSSNIEPLRRLDVEIFFGDVGDKNSFNAALKGIDIVIHAAAGTSGSKKDSKIGTLLGTRHVLELCKTNAASKLIYISSCSVYGIADYGTNQMVTEACSLEKFPSQRGHYSASKQQAEVLVHEAMKSADYSIVILRPGTIYGPGGEVFTPMMGFSLKNKVFIVIGNGRFRLPLVYIDNLVEAILQAASNDKANNQIFNVVDTEKITKKRYMAELVKRLYPDSYAIYFPYWILYGLVWFLEKGARLLQRTPFLTTYRLISSQKPIVYSASKIENTTGWRSQVSFNQATEKIINSHHR